MDRLGGAARARQRLRALVQYRLPAARPVDEQPISIRCNQFTGGNRDVDANSRRSDHSPSLRPDRLVRLEHLSSLILGMAAALALLAVLLVRWLHWREQRVGAADKTA